MLAWAVGSAGAAQLSGSPTWHISASVGVKGGTGTMTSVVATGRSDAWAAGLVCAPGCPGSRSLVVRRWNGGKWLTVAPPKGLTSATNLLNGALAGASSATNAFVFALLDQPTSSRTDALHWTGKHWTVAKFPQFSQITGTEVFSAKNAWAFGISGRAGKPYDARFTGRAWHTVSMPGNPVTVSATSASDMWGIGPTTKTATKPLGQQSYIAMHWTGSSWHTVALPSVSKPAGDFVVPGTVVALGPKNVWESYGLGNAGTCCLFGGIEHWDGSKWHAVSIPLPVDRLTSMSSDGHGGVWMIVSTGSTLSLAFYHDNAGHWSQASPPTFVNATIVPQDLAWVPGTRNEWTGGTNFLTGGSSAGVILTYSK